MTASNASTLRYPKGKTRKQVKARKVRIDNGTQSEVRDAIFTREEYRCAVASRLSQSDMLAVCKQFGLCWGQLTPAHLKGHRRSATRNQEPSVRHSTAHELALCEVHHSAEEHLGLRFVGSDPELGMDSARITYRVEPEKRQP